MKRREPNKWLLKFMIQDAQAAGSQPILAKRNASIAENQC